MTQPKLPETAPIESFTIDREQAVWITAVMRTVLRLIEHPMFMTIAAAMEASGDQNGLFVRAPAVVFGYLERYGQTIVTDLTRDDFKPLMREVDELIATAMAAAEAEVNGAEKAEAAHDQEGSEQ